MSGYWDQDSDDVRDDAQSRAFNAVSAAFAQLMNVCADIDPHDVARDLVETWVQDRAHGITADRYAHDELMAFVASRDEMPIGRDEPREIDSPCGVPQREDEPCQRGTIGCSVDHVADESCETW